jgi:hypothetical protein
MAVQVTISSITGQSPYDIYICQTGGTSCFYMTTISSVPYIFDIPSPYNTSDAYMLKIIDNNGCTITGIEPVTTCPGVTPTITPTNTVTPSVTPSCVDVVTNGEFTTNLSGWDNDNLFPWVWSSSYGGSAESTGLDALSKIRQSCLTENCEYQITIDVEIPNSGPLFVVVAGAEGIGVPSGSNVSSQITTSGIYTFNLTCTGSSYLQIFTFDPAGNYVGFVKSITACLLNCLTPTPTQTSTPTVTPTTTLTSTPGLSPNPTGTQTSTPTNTPTVTPTTTITSTPGLSPNPTNTQTLTPTITPTPTEALCECVRIIFTGTNAESSYNISFIDCNGISQNETIGAFSEAYCVSANTEINSDGRSFYYDGCCECGGDVPCEKWGVYANSGSITFTYTACDGSISGVTLNSNESAFVCIQPGTENIPLSTLDATAIQIGCCCECESYSITGNTTYGTTVYGVRYCGDNFSQLPITIPPGDVIQICVDARYLFLALVDGTNEGVLILPDVESLGCCNVSP